MQLLLAMDLLINCEWDCDSSSICGHSADHHIPTQYQATYKVQRNALNCNHCATRISDHRAVSYMCKSVVRK